MGGYNSGGHNRQHDYTARYKRLDSFDYGKAIPILREKGFDNFRNTVSWKDGGNIGIVLYPNRLEVDYSVGSGTDRETVHDVFHFAEVPNNYGGNQRIYFQCPHCDRRSRFLYLHAGRFKCRKCADLNYYSQQVTHNEDETVYKMEKLLRDKFKVKDSLAPCDLECYYPTRPKGMRTRTYMKLLAEFQTLQDKYGQQFIAKACKIIGCQTPDELRNYGLNL